MFVKKKNKKL